MEEDIEYQCLEKLQICHVQFIEKIGFCKPTFLGLLSRAMLGIFKETDDQQYIKYRNFT